MDLIWFFKINRFSKLVKIFPLLKDNISTYGNKDFFFKSLAVIVEN